MVTGDPPLHLGLKREQQDSHQPLAKLVAIFDHAVGLVLIGRGRLLQRGPRVQSTHPGPQGIDGLLI
eukprot:15045168-Alexandrium_andersonii.AAC.1